MRRTPEPPRWFTWPHYSMVRCGLPAIWALCGGWRVDGVEQIPRNGGAVIAPNHVSYFDPPAVGSSLPRRTYYMAKRELFEVPVFGWLIRKSYAFPVERGVPDREAIRHAIDILQRGELLVVFPEGERSTDGRLGEGNIGAALIASRAKVPIIPCAIYGSDRVLPRHARFPHCHRVHVSFGEPILIEQPAEGHARKAELMAATARLMTSLAALQARQQALYSGGEGTGKGSAEA